MADTDPWEKPASVSAAVPTADPWEKPATPQEKNAGTKREHGVIDKLFGLGTERYQIWPERAVRDVASIPKRAIEGVTSGAPGSHEVTRATVPATTDAALAAIRPARMSMEVGNAMKGAKGAKPRSQDQLFEDSNAKYAKLRQDGIKLRGDVLDGLRDNIQDSLIENGFRDYSHGGTFKAIEEITKPVGKGTPGDIETVRQVLGRLRGNPNESAAASLAIEKIDDYLSNIPDVADTAKAARSDWAKAKKSQAITGAEQRGADNAATSGMAGNLPNTIRQRLKALLYDKKTSRYLNDEEKEGIRDVLKRNTFDHLIEGMARLGPKHPITGWATAAIADLSHGMGAASASLGLGHLAQKLAEYRIGKKVDRLDEGIRGEGVKDKPSLLTRLSKPKNITIPTVGTMLSHPADDKESVDQLIQRLGQ